MKKLLLTTLSIAMAATTGSFAQTNLNLEAWSGTECDGWLSLNVYTGLGAPQTLYQETADVGEGASSARITTGYWLGATAFGAPSDTVGGFLSMGVTGGDLTAGVPYTDKPTSVDFMMKSDLEAGDTGVVFVQLSRWDTALNTTMVVAQGVVLGVDSGAWLAVSVGLYYFDTINSPDSMQIICVSSVGTLFGSPLPIIGSTIYVDAFVFNGVCTLTATGTDPTGCGTTDGTATANATGGTTPYSYSWSNGDTTAAIVGLTGGTYTITITDAGGCNATASVTLTSAGAPTLSMINSDLSCYGDANGTAGVTVSGGIAPYTYAWSNSQTAAILTGLAGGTYSVTVTDGAGCITTGSVTIEEPAELMASIASTDVSCTGGSDGACDLTVTGGTIPYVFSWSNSETTEDISGLSSGVYSVDVTDSNSCTTNESATINESSSGPQTGSILGLTQVNPLDQEQYVVSQTVGSSYNWSVIGGNIVSGQGTNALEILWGNPGTGQITVVETDDAGCVGDTVTLEVQIGTSSGILFNANANIYLYPNPTTGILTIEGVEGIVEIYDIYGRRILTANTNTVDLSNAAMGIYFVRVLDEQPKNGG